MAAFPDPLFIYHPRSGIVSNWIATRSELICRCDQFIAMIHVGGDARNTDDLIRFSIVYCVGFALGVASKGSCNVD